MGLLSFPTTGKRLPWSAPFKRCVFFSFILITWTCFLFTGRGKIISNERSGHSRERGSEAQIDARNHRVGRGRGEKRNVGEMPARYLGSGGVPVIWASRAATAERRLAGITFA